MNDMQQKKPYQAFILGAGFGTRLRPLTDHCPKPMVEIAGRSLIWRILDKLRAVGVYDVVVNVHYLADILIEHLKNYEAQHEDIKITIFHEKEILNTGGGIKNALSHFDPDCPFYVIAGDALWSDGAISALDRLADGWDDAIDILTLMQPLSRMSLTKGVGDYDLLPDGHVKRSHNKNGAYMWTNIRLNRRRIYEGDFAKDFSFLEIMDACEEKGRFFAYEHEGGWHHISTPDDHAHVDALYRKEGI